MRAIDDLFSRPNADKIKVSLSFIEIYNDRAYDLLSETPAKQSNVKGMRIIIVFNYVFSTFLCFQDIKTQLV